MANIKLRYFFAPTAISVCNLVWRTVKSPCAGNADPSSCRRENLVCPRRLRRPSSCWWTKKSPCGSQGGFSHGVRAERRDAGGDLGYLPPRCAKKSSGRRWIKTGASHGRSWTSSARAATGWARSNISTTSAILCAAAGVAVAKHGNPRGHLAGRSADVLEAAGIRIDHSPEEAAHSLREKNFAFFFAPTFSIRRSSTSGAARALWAPPAASGRSLIFSVRC